MDLDGIGGLRRNRAAAGRDHRMLAACQRLPAAM